MQTIFWHDYETFGADPQKDRPCQFAGVRTDLDLNLVGEPITIYSKPCEDYLPAPAACLVTGITPQEALEKGVVEAEFAAKIVEIFSEPETCVAGYNSIRFDDEVSRNLFYRNFIDPYEREWKNGNSRWDLIDVVRLTHALRPEGIVWPKGDDGKVSFRLEKLTEANGISHEAAHDAMSDVYATIALAKLIKEKQPALFKYAFGLRTKNAVKDFIDANLDQPFLHVSSKFPVAKGCMAMMFPLAHHPTNKNAIIAFDLRQDPQFLLDKTADELKALLYKKLSYDDQGNPEFERPAIKLIHINKCPMLAPASMIKVVPEEKLDAWGMNLSLLRANLKKLRSIRESLSYIPEVFSLEPDRPSSADPDLMIYSGGFFSPNDKQEMRKIQQSSGFELEALQLNFQDPRLDEMYFRYKARNYPEAMSSQEREKWMGYCSDKLLNEQSEHRNFQSFANELQSLAASLNQDADAIKLSVLEDVQLYAESIYPF